MRALVLTLFLFSGCSVQGGGEAQERAARECGGISSLGGMVWVEGGEFFMGEDPRYPEEGPPREVQVPGFWISNTEITNSQFADFILDTGYVTLAEREPPAIPGAPPEMNQAGSATFKLPTHEDPSWWAWTVGAQWRIPNGPGSSIEGRAQDPVVQIAYDDALAYAEWTGMSLPSEEQWEYAARGGSDSLPEPKDASGKPLANYYQGVFPSKDLGEDGFTSRAPVGCFEPNAFGLYDMIGNVWEWTSTEGERADAMEQVGVIKGGSFLCAANYCARYRPAARQFQERGLGTDHIGFRVVDTNRAAPGSNRRE